MSTPPTAIASTFACLKSRGQMAFMPFVTAGDPDMATTLALIRELSRRGVDLIEVGFPYSDPIADGPVIQASYTRALRKQLHVADIFDGVTSLAHDRLPPLVAMVSFSIVFRTGAEQFVQRARDAGFSGLIVPDLPGDEADELSRLVTSVGLNLIPLIAPTTTPDRVARILKTASGFVYCISVAGTTGVRTQLPSELAEQLRGLRAQTDLPLAVGFGISRPDQVDSLRGLADGIIVGSAIVRQLEPPADGTSRVEDVLQQIGQFAADMTAATRRPQRI